MKSKILRNGIAGAMLASLPLTVTGAATRPNAAVPTMSSAAVVAQYDEDDQGIPWLALAAIGLAAGVALWILLDDDDEGEGAISRA